MQIGACKLLEQIQRKPWATLHRGLHEPSGRQVAVKLDAPQHALGEVTIERLAPVLWGPLAVGCLREHEARVLARLHGHGVPVLLDAGRYEGQAYVAIEWLPGTPASRFAFTPGARFAELLELATRAAEILARAHACGVVHRDITPSNLLVHRCPGGGLEVTIIDWELASMDGQRSWGAVGTMAYRAPELTAAAAGHQVDACADLYALGATLFHLAAGRPPVPGDRVLAARHTLAPCPSLASMCSDAPPPLVALVDALLHKDPRRRPACAARIAAAPDCQTEPEPPGAELQELGALSRVEAALAQGQPVCAAQHLRDTAMQERDQPAYELAWARVWHMVDCHAMAEGAARRALAAAPGAGHAAAAAQALALLAQALRLQGRLPEAAAAIAQAQTAHPRSPSVLAELARMQLLVEPPASAYATCLRLLSLDEEAGYGALAEQIEHRLQRLWQQPTLHDLEALAVLATLLGLHRRSRSLGHGGGDGGSDTLLELALAAGRRWSSQVPDPLPPLMSTALAAAGFELGQTVVAMGHVRALAQDGFHTLRSLIPLAADELAYPHSAHWMCLLELGQARLAGHRATAPQCPAEPALVLAQARVALVTGQLQLADRLLASLGPMLPRPAVAELRGVSLIRQQQHAQAASELNVTVEAHPVAAGCWTVLAMAYLAGGEAHHAHTSACRAAELAPWNLHNHRLVYRAARQCGVWQSAVQAIAALGEPTGEALEHLAACLGALEQLPAVAGLQELVLRAEAAHPALVASVATHMLRLAPADQQLGWHQLAHRTLVGLGRTTQALDLARARAAGVTELLLHVDAALRAGRYQEALQASERAVAVAPDDGLLGWVRLRVHQQAGWLVELAVSRPQPGRPAEAVAQVLALEALERLDEARAAAREHGLEDSRQPEVMALRLRMAAAAEAWDEVLAAVEDPEAAGSRSDPADAPDDLQVAFWRVRAHCARGRYGDAHAVAAGLPARERASVHLSIELAAGRIERVVEHGHQALERYRADPDVLFAVGAALAASERHEEAEPYAAELIQSWPADARGWWLAAWCHSAAERHALARQMAEGLLGVLGPAVTALCTYAHVMLSAWRFGEAERAASRCQPRSSWERELVADLRQRLAGEPIDPHAHWSMAMRAFGMLVPGAGAGAMAGRVC